MPPRSDRESYLAPGKKKKNVKCHAKNWYKCESNTCAFTECKNGRTLVKYGNLRLLIRDQTTLHCDVRNSECQIEPWGVRRNLTPYAVSKNMSSWQCDWCFLSANKFQCHQTKTNTFVCTLRMFHKALAFAMQRVSIISGSVSREINLEPFLVETLQTLYYST